jgi:aldehyde:ferredoxin oxidoreductase
VHVHGFHGRLLHVDLTSGRHSYRDLDAARLRMCLGGIGLGASLLHEYAPEGVDPLAPANPLIFASAPLVGTTLTTTAKFAVVTKSPLTGFIADSLSSSHFALELKRLGVDALVITGQAPSLAYLFIDGDRVEIRDAATLRGKTPEETQAFVRADISGVNRASGVNDSSDSSDSSDANSANGASSVNDGHARTVWVASIGLAGEQCVRFATISNEGRHAGRGGVGAVMGAKHLKAIAVRGDQPTSVASASDIAAIADSLRRRSLGSVTDKYRRVGTVANLSVFNRLGTLPTRNFQQATFEGADALSGETLTETSFSRRHGCASCTIRCERLFKSQTQEEQRLEYETLFALGPLCGISDPACVLEAVGLCDRYGLDAISAGGTIAWAIESIEKGLLPDARALDLRFGHGAGVIAAIHAIARRDGVGALLAEGSRQAARETGGESGYWAMHVKGLELPGYEPRSLKTLALGLAVSPRGACHNRSGAYEADFSGAVDRFHGDASRGALVAASEDFGAVLDSLIVCKFLRKCFDDFYSEAAEIIAGVTGWNYTAAELRTSGERIHTLKKLFNIREQWRPDDDWLPERLLTEPLTDAGVADGASLSRDELREMIRGYYEARGWDQRGFVPEHKLAQLGLVRSRTAAAGS